MVVSLMVSMLGKQKMQLTSAMVVEQRSVERRRKHARSRVSNGRDVLPNVDGRSLVARRYRDISTAILIDQGGLDQCSESRQQLIRRFAAAAVLAEQMESRLANGEQIDVAEHATLSSTLVRLAAKIGIDRVPREVTPTLQEYLAGLPEDAPAGEPVAETVVPAAAVSKSSMGNADALDEVSS